MNSQSLEIMTFQKKRLPLPRRPPTKRREEPTIQGNLNLAPEILEQLKRMGAVVKQSFLRYIHKQRMKFIFSTYDNVP